MSHTIHQLYHHFIWATHSRKPLISREWRLLLKIISEKKNLRGGFTSTKTGDGPRLSRRPLSATVLISDFVGKVKGAISHRVNRHIKPTFKLQWQEGCGVDSLRCDDLEKVYHYIDHQEDHHRSRKVSSSLGSTRTMTGLKPLR